MCVSECVSVCARLCARAGTGSPRSARPVREDATASAGTGTRAPSEGLCDVRGCSPSGAQALQTSRGPALSPWAAQPSTRLLRILGSLARRPEPGDACSAPGRRREVSGPEGEQEKRRKLVSGSCAHTPTPRHRPQSKPLCPSPRPTSLRFFRTRNPQILSRAESEGKPRSEARAI